MNDKFEIAKLRFILIGAGAYLITLLFNKFLPCKVIEDILSTLGGLFLITGIFDVWLKKEYLTKISEEVINGFFANESALANIKKDQLKTVLTQMYKFLAKDIQDVKVRQCFFDLSTNKNINLIFGETGNACYFTEYHLSVVLHKINRHDTFAKATYKLRYTMINNSETPMKHKIFKARAFPVPQDFAHDTQKLKNLKINIDDLETINYSKDISESKFKVKVKNDVESTTLESVDGERIVTEILYNNDPFIIEFKKKLFVEKEITVFTDKNDIIMNYLFHYAAKDVIINFMDENAKKIEIIKYTTFKKSKEAIDLTVLAPNNICLKFNEVLLPRDGISFVLFR